MAMTLPGAWEDQPWENDTVVKVGKKIFAFFGGPQSTGFSVKLPASSSEALMIPCVKPTGYGLGRAGWVTVEFESPECPPYEILAEWLLESHRAVAPKSLLKESAAKSPAAKGGRTSRQRSAR